MHGSCGSVGMFETLMNLDTRIPYINVNLGLSYAGGRLTALRSGLDADHGAWPPSQEIWHDYESVRLLVDTGHYSPTQVSAEAKDLSTAFRSRRMVMVVVGALGHLVIALHISSPHTRLSIFRIPLLPE